MTSVYNGGELTSELFVAEFQEFIYYINPW